MLKNTIVLVFGLLLSVSAFARIWKVDDTGYGAPSIGGTLTLPMAISAASANDTILINIKGTMIVFGPNLVFDKPLTIIGPEAAHFTIDVNSWQVIFDIPAGNINLEGIRFTSLPFLCGDYISVQQGTNLTIRNCVFETTQISGNGGAIKMMHTSTMNVENSSFFNCEATGVGGAIYIGNSNSAVIRNCTFFDNTAVEGGAIFNDGNVTLVNNTFLNNTSTNNAGHALKDGNTAAGTFTKIQNNIFTDVVSGKLPDVLQGSLFNMWQTDGGNIIPSSNILLDFIPGSGTNDRFSESYSGLGLRANPVTNGYGLKYFPVISQLSSAIDNGTGGVNVPFSDCRRAPRALYGDNVLAVDAGAVEFTPFTVTSNISAGFNTTWGNLNASSFPGPKYMDFDISGGGPVNYNLSSTLNNSTSNGMDWIIDGFTQDGSIVPGPGTTPTTYTPGVYMVNIINNSSNVISLNNPGGNSFISGLSIDNGNGNIGIQVNDGAIHIYGNHVISTSGTGAGGILLTGANNSTIGGNFHHNRNVISNQVDVGIHTQNDQTFINGNFIGTNPTGLSAMGNNKGILLQGNTGLVVGKYGMPSMNLVSGNGQSQIEVATGYFVIGGNIIGPDVTSNNVISATARGIEVGINTDGKIGNVFPGSMNVIGGNGDGILITAANQVEILHNYIGISPNGMAGFPAIPNSTGVSIIGNGDANHFVGNGTIAGRNYICNNSSIGVYIEDAQFHSVAGNFIGVKPDNTMAGNGTRGIHIVGASSEGQDILGNIISGHSAMGIDVNGTNGAGNISGNKIGTDSLGTNFLANGRGINIASTPSNSQIIGNLISGNTNEGIFLDGSMTVIDGNIIGLTLDTTTALANGGAGILLQNTNNSTIINNIISANGGEGILIGAGSTNFIRNNFIGTNRSGINLGNNAHGIKIIFVCSNNTIGSTNPNDYNTIAFNNGAGIDIERESSFNGILGNHFFQNAGNAISLNAAVSAALPLPNDANDTDVSGPAIPDMGNNGQNYPVINSLTVCGGSATLNATLNIADFPNDYYIQIYKVNPGNIDGTGHGEGDSLIMSYTLNATTNTNTFNVTIPGLPIGEIVSVTASKFFSGFYETSEFSDTAIVSNALTATATVANNVSCFGLSDGTVTVTHSGAAPFTYNWYDVSTGLTTGANSQTASLPAGTYTCLVTDATCSVYSDTIIVTEPPALTVSTVTLDPTCIVNGSIDITATGGTGGYLFDWSDDGTGDTDDIEDLSAPAGTYTVDVIDANGCIFSVPAITLNNPPLPSMTPTFTAESCSGLNDGTISVTPGGGTAPFSYQIDGGGYGPSTFFGGLAPGNHIVDISDANGCTGNILVNILAGELVVADFSVTNVSACQNSPDFDLTDVSITSTGVSSWNYTLPSGSPSSGTVPNITGVILFNAGANLITLQVISNGGCTDDTTMTVNTNPAIFVDAGLDSIICLGDFYTQAATVVGGSGGNIYNWQPSGNFVSNTIEDADVTVALENTIGYFEHILQVIDVNGCTDRDTMYLDIRSIPTVSAGADAAVCQGSPYTLSGSGTATTYTWDNSVVDGSPFNPLSTITYTVTGTDAVGCANTDQVTITVDLPATLDVGLDFDECRTTAFSANLNASATNFGSITWTTLGTGSWNNTSILNPTYFYSGADASGASVSLVAVVTSASGSCSTVDDTITITFHDAPSVFAGNDFSVCASSPSVTLNGSTTSALSVDWTGGAGTYSPDNLNSIANYVPSAGEISAGTVTLTLTAYALNAACADVTDDITITLLASPVANAGFDGTICTSQAYTLDGAASTGTITNYSWDEVGGVNVGSTVLTNVSPVTNTYYALTVTNGTCSDSDTMFLNIVTAPDASFTYSPNIFCLNDTDPIPATINTAGGTFSMPATSSINTSTGLISLSAIGAGTFDVVYTLNTPCFSDDTFQIIVNPLPDVTVNGPIYICANTPPFDLNTNFPPPTSGGTWSGSGVSGVNFDASLAGIGTFGPTYTVTDANNCTNSDSITIVVQALPTPTFSGVGSVYCQTDPPIVMVGNPTGGTWIVDAVNVGTITSLDPSSFTVGNHNINYEYIDPVTGCLSTAVPIIFNVYSVPLDPTTTSPLSQSICAGNNVVLNATNTNGGGTQLAWYSDAALTVSVGFGPAFTSPALSSSTTYYVVIQNNGCKSNPIVFDITVNNAQVTAVSDITTCPGVPAQLNVSISSGTISWSPGNLLSDSTIQNPLASPVNDTTVFVVTVTDGVCVAYDSVNVYIDGSDPDCGFTPSFNAFSPDRDGVNDNWIIDAVFNHLDNTVSIYNRWGDKLVSFEDYDNVNVVWDGTYNGNLLPTGTYFYVIEYHDINQQISGWVQLTH